jgi:hypothetical protein
MADDNARTHELLRHPRSPLAPRPSNKTTDSGRSSATSSFDSLRNTPPCQPRRKLELVPHAAREQPVGSNESSSRNMSDLDVPSSRRSVSHELKTNRRSSLDLSQSKLRTTRWQAGDMFSTDSQISMMAPPRAPPTEYSPKMDMKHKQKKTLGSSYKVQGVRYPQTWVSAKSLDEMLTEDCLHSHVVIPEDPSRTLDEALDLVRDHRRACISA